MPPAAEITDNTVACPPGGMRTLIKTRQNEYPTDYFVVGFLRAVKLQPARESLYGAGALPLAAGSGLADELGMEGWMMASKAACRPFLLSG